MGLAQDPIARGEICSLSGKEMLAKGRAKSTAKRQRRGMNLQAYKCRACGGWHVGNKRRFAA